MSYLKLQSGKIRYNTNSNPVTVICSEVIDSACSYYTPKLVSSGEELDIYFGTSFTQREFYDELLYRGTSLLLYKPIKENTYGENFIDLSEYTIYKEPYGNGEAKDYVFYDDLPSEGRPNGETEDPKYMFYVSSDDAWYIWYEEGGYYVDTTELPNDIGYSSLINRDTLRINSVSFANSEKFSYCHPKYRSLEYEPSYSEIIPEDYKDSLLQSIYSHGVDDETRAAMFTLDFTNVTEFTETDYFVVPLAEDENIIYPRLQLYFGSSAPLGADIIKGAYSAKVTGDTIDDKISSILEILEKHNYQIIKESDKVYKIFSKDLIQDLHFFNVSGLVFEIDFEGTQNLYSILSENYKRIELYSKTIGPGDEDIKVKIEKLSGDFTEHYRFTISRYTYSEVFEGSLYIEENEETGKYESLEQIINQGSKLVEIKIFKSGFSKDDSDSGLIEGEYYLKRSKDERDYTPEDYWRGLEEIKNTGIKEDFLLVPEIEDYEIIGATSDQVWIKEYEDLLDYATEKNCQVLISNHKYTFGCTNTEIVYLNELPDSPVTKTMYGIGDKDTSDVLYETWDGENWKIWNSDSSKVNRVYEILETFDSDYTGNHIFNYTKDNWNRLVYFYEDMTYMGYYRPAYYIFLSGVIGGTYSEETNKIVYTSPVDLYSEDTSNLESYKSNFLSCNEHIYYYRKFFSHTGDYDYEVTILTRFCMDKTTNTIERDFPQYLGLETSGEIIRGLNSILDSLKTTYPIIYSLSLDYIEEDVANQKLSIYLDLEVKELVDKDVKLSVTLNFNN